MQAFIGDQFEYSQDRQIHDSLVQFDMLLEALKECKGIGLPTINEMLSGSNRFVNDLKISISNPNFS